MSGSNVMNQSSLEKVMKGDISEMTGLGDRLQTSISPNALYYAQKLAAEKPDLYHPNLAVQPGRLVWIPTRFDDHESETALQSNERKLITVEERKLLTVEFGAHSEYDTASYANPFSALFGLVLYVTATALVLYIIIIQSMNVAKQAGFPMG